MKSIKIWFGALVSTSFVGISIWYFFFNPLASNQDSQPTLELKDVQEKEVKSKAIEPVDSLDFKKNDSVEYFKRIRHLAHDSVPKPWQVFSIYPGNEAILPYHRIVAMYGNFYSKSMGILGRVSEEELLNQFRIELTKWSEADSLTPALPAVHYIAITAQKDPGPENHYRLRMPKDQLEKAILLGRTLGGITFLDVQVGHSSVEQEVPTLEKFLLEKDVHLGLDPEWSMKDGSVPGTKIGTLDAKDINFAIQYLSDLVLKNGLPPKILVVHRFSQDMITNYQEINATPQVQVVVNMDGFGFPAKKVTSYRKYVGGMPVQFTGIKLFYMNDTLEAPHRLMTPREILSLYPKPIYIQYQ